MSTPDFDRMQAFAESPEGRRATAWAGEHMSTYGGGPYHPESVKNALRPPDARFYGGAHDAVAILQCLLDVALSKRNPKARPHA